jgi:hypothetical protein
VNATENRACILFADICDSTPLYEQSGDAVALQVIARCLDGLARLAARHGGDVIRSKGDDLLCTFEQPAHALDAAASMILEQDPDLPPIHVGIHFGTVLHARSDIYGDAVNVAARMLALAKPGEVVASREVVDALPDTERHRLTLIGTRPLKGRQEPVEVYSMVLDEGDVTHIVWPAGARGAPAPPDTVMPVLVLELEYDGQVVTVRDGERCLVGRAPRCDLVVAERCVSREHAVVEVHAGRATLTDKSSTGSWILDRDGGHTTLRRDTGALPGRGAIRLGRHPRDAQPAPEIRFALRAVG